MWGVGCRRSHRYGPVQQQCGQTHIDCSNRSDIPCTLIEGWYDASQRGSQQVNDEYGSARELEGIFRSPYCRNRDWIQSKHLAALQPFALVNFDSLLSWIPDHWLSLYRCLPSTASMSDSTSSIGSRLIQILHGVECNRLLFTRLNNSSSPTCGVSGWVNAGLKQLI